MNNFFLVLLSSFGVLSSTLIILYLWFDQKGSQLFNRTLALLFFCISIRVGKAIVYYHFGLEKTGVFLGLAAFSAIGPSLYLTIKSLYEASSLKGSFLKESLHFIPAMALMIAAFLLSNTSLSEIQHTVYVLILIHFPLYLILSGYLIRSYVNKQVPGSQKNKISIHLLSAVGIIYLAYAIDFIPGVNLYFLSALMYSLMVYLFIYLQISGHINWPSLFHGESYRYLNPRKNSPEKQLDEIESFISGSEIYLDPDFNLDKASDKLNLTKHELSELINRVGGSSFPSFVNKYRIDYAAKQLADKEKNISEIAYASGFNSLSTFNQSFKDQKGCTPTQFRKKIGYS